MTARIQTSPRGFAWPHAATLIAGATWLPPVLHAPFDAARAAYSASVNAGLVPSSQIAAARFERDLSALERATLGFAARSR
jgi:hypothetical protein